MFLSLVSFALAQPLAMREVAVGAGLSGEAVMQGGLVDAYQNLGGSLSIEAHTHVTLTIPVELSFQVTYRRVEGERTDGSGSWLWYLPIAGLVSGRADFGSLTLLGGLGPTVVTWQEEGSPEAVAGREDWGARWGVLIEGSVRWHTSALRPPIYADTRTNRGLDVYASVGTRMSDVADAAESTGCSDAPCGFDWSAMRLGAGVLVRF